MLKSGIILINVFVLLLYSFFAGDQGKITLNYPTSVEAGQDFQLDVMIDKADINGFAKFQIELPNTFDLMLVDDKNNKDFTFAYKDGIAKVIWMTLPKTKELKVSFIVKTDKSASGEVEIKSDFSFLVNNTKQKTTNNPKINIINPNVAANQIAKKNEEAKPEELPLKENNESNENQTSQTTSSQNDNINAVRTLDLTNLKANREFTVEILVKKSNVEGFGKLQDILPVGFTAKPIATGEAAFSFVDQKVKFLWMSMPAKPEFTVSYKVTVDKGIIGEFFINGDFGYLKDEETQKYDLERTSVLIETGEMAEQPMIAENKTETSVTPDKPIEAAKNDSQKPVMPEITEAKPKKPENKPAPAKKEAPKISTPVAGLHYKVQLAAGKKQVTPNVIQKLYKISEEVVLEQHEGWFKYTTGQFDVYKAARDHREEMRNNYATLGAFVTAYNNNTRITVQEALMISNQKWIK